MDHSRRALISAALAGTAAAPPSLARDSRTGPLGNLGLDATGLGLVPGSPDDQSAALGKALTEAARRRAPLLLPPGRYRVSGVEAPEGAQLIGSGDCRLIQAAAAPLVTARGLRRLALIGLTFDGLARETPGGTGLVSAEGVAALAVEDCGFVAAVRPGLTLARCGGRVATSRFEDMGDSGLFSIDATGLAILDNEVKRCGNNGIQVWRSEKGDDGTILRGNRISDIHFDAGGTGENGNGISIFRAGGVIVEGNVVRGCALSAIRNNSGSNCQIVGNNCARAGETAIWSEFAFEGAMISNNVVDDAATGISITNLDKGGRLAVCSGNLIRRMTRRRSPYEEQVIGGVGIHVEAETAVTGNVIEEAAAIGISAGWAWAMRNLIVTGNMIRGAPVGVAVSVAPAQRNALISGNVIADASKGAVVGFLYDDPVTGDLTRGPDEKASGVRVEGNAVT